MNPCRGAHTDLEQLIRLRHSGRQLNLVQRNRALSALSGPNKSNFRGRGIDFEEVRAYQPGDDIRTIDWRVTARTGNAHTKIFREERERPVLVVSDQRNSMFFGSRHCCKSVLAANAAALLCWAALDQGDRVGGMVFNDLEHIEIRPRRSRTSVLSYLHQLCEMNRQLPLAPSDSPTQSFSDVLVELRRIARPGSAIFLVSDFQGAFDELAMEHLYQLSRHTEITALHCHDHLEQHLPGNGNYRVTDGQNDAALSTSDGNTRNEFTRRYRTHLTQLHESYGKLGIPIIEVSTDQAPLAVLLPLYGDSARQQGRA